MPGCVRVFGAVDQIGNVWEWTDSGVRLDSATALAALAASGISLTLDPDSALILAEGAAGALTLDVAGLQPGDVAADEGGHLYVTASQIQPSLDSFSRAGTSSGPTRPASGSRSASCPRTPWTPPLPGGCTSPLSTTAAPCETSAGAPGTPAPATAAPSPKQAWFTHPTSPAPSAFDAWRRPTDRADKGPPKCLSACW